MKQRFRSHGRRNVIHSRNTCPRCQEEITTDVSASIRPDGMAGLSWRNQDTGQWCVVAFDVDTVVTGTKSGVGALQPDGAGCSLVVAGPLDGADIEGDALQLHEQAAVRSGDGATGSPSPRPVPCVGVSPKSWAATSGRSGD